jgi:hypothetical protein
VTAGWHDVASCLRLAGKEQAEDSRNSLRVDNNRQTAGCSLQSVRSGFTATLSIILTSVRAIFCCAALWHNPCDQSNAETAGKCSPLQENRRFITLFTDYLILYLNIISFS